MNIAAPKWYSAELAAGITATRTVRYRKELNTVYIEGWVIGATISGTVFMLPEGFRPPILFEAVVPASSSGTGTNAARIQIRSTGIETYVDATNASVLSNGSCVDCCFTAAQ